MNGTTAGSKSIAARLRAMCLALPEAVEQAIKRGPSYRVAGKIFALERRRGAGLALWCKVPQGSQQILVGADPERFSPRPILAPRTGSASSPRRAEAAGGDGGRVAVNGGVRGTAIRRSEALAGFALFGSYRPRLA
jgi:hypothetical protein